MKGMPYLMCRIFCLLLFIASMVSSFKIHWVSCHADSNRTYPTSIACKMANLLMFSDGRNKCGCTLAWFAGGVDIYALIPLVEVLIYM